MNVQPLHAPMKPGDLALINDPQAVQMMNLYLNRQSPPALIKFWTTNVAGAVDHENESQFLARITPAGQPDQIGHAGLDILPLRDPAT